MAANWVNIGDRTPIGYSGTTYAWVRMQYDSNSVGVNRACRVVIEQRSGYTFSVYFRNFKINGTVQFTQKSITQNNTGADDSTHAPIWSGSLAGGTTYTVEWTCPWYAGTASYKLENATVPSGATAPSGGSCSLTSRTWNSVGMDASVSSWGSGYDSDKTHLAQCVCSTSATSSNWLQTARRVKWTNTTNKSVSGTVTNNNSTQYDGGIDIKGCLGFKIAGYGYSATGTTEIGNTWAFINTICYLPPAPLASITQSQTRGSTNVSISAVITGGSSANNYNETVTTYWRYSTNGGSSWTGWGNAGTGLPWTAKTVTFTAAYGASIKVEAYQSYKNQDSEHTTISFTALSAETPSNLASSITASTWNSVTMSGSCTYNKPDGISGRSLTVGVNANGTGLAGRREVNTQNVTSVSGKVINNSSTAQSGGITLKGMLAVYPYAWASNTVNSANAIGSVYYLPPAPGTITYVEPPVGDTQYSVYYNGVAANNVTGYDASELRRTVRYKLAGDANWTVVVDNAIVGLTTTTGFNINIPAQSSATVEGWLTYRGKNSEVSSALLTNSSDPVYIYGSVGGETKQVHHVYGSVNGETKKIRRIYASVNGVARKVFEDGS